jgi:hypothetical protein
MIHLILGLFWGFIFGYCVCMIKVRKLRVKINNLKVDLMHKKE